MIARRSGIAILVVLGSCTVFAQDRQLIVKDSGGEIKRLAFHLGVAPAQVMIGREVLSEVTDMAVELASQQRISPLGRFWLTLDRSGAKVQLSQLVQRLREGAEEAATQEKFERITQSAFSIATTLRPVDPPLADRLMEEWPEYTRNGDPQEADPSAHPSRERRSFEENRIRQQFQEDPERALSELRALETETIDVRLRATAIRMLFVTNREAEARALLEDTLGQVDALPPSGRTLTDLSNLLDGIPADLETSRTVLNALASVYRRTTQPLERQRRFMGLPVNEAESAILRTLRRLPPQLTLDSLQLFPDLAERIESEGGVDVIIGGQGRPRQARQPTTKTTAQTLGEALNRTTSNRYWGDYENVLGELEALLPKIRELEEPMTRAQLLSRWLSNYFGLMGHLGSGLRQTMMDCVDEAREESLPAEQETLQPAVSDNVNQLEAMVYGMWLWSNPTEARAAMTQLEPPQRFRAMTSYLAALIQPHYRNWR